jgi:LEA14-like dessication related protein
MSAVEHWREADGSWERTSDHPGIKPESCRDTPRMKGHDMIVLRMIPVMALAVALLAPEGCATLHGRDPLQVTVAGIEPLQGQGLELRMLMKLRVQNPNDAPVDYNGVSVEMNVQGKTFATGVSDVGGSVPRFGESVISVPVTVSAFRMVHQAVDMIRRGGTGTITYEMKGKLNGSTLNSMRFRTRGEFDLPATSADDAG